MSETTPNPQPPPPQGDPAANPAVGQQPPPAGQPPAGAPPGYYPPPAGAPPQGYAGYPPYGYYPPPQPGYWPPPPPGQAPYPSPVQAPPGQSPYPTPPPGQYPPPHPGQYPPYFYGAPTGGYGYPPPGQGAPGYPPPPGAPPPTGPLPPNTTGTPAESAPPSDTASKDISAPPTANAGWVLPPAGAVPPGYPPPAGYPGYPPAFPPAFPQAGPPTGPYPLHSTLPKSYLGAQIVPLETPTAPLTTTKVPGYNPSVDYNALMKLAAMGIAEPLKVAQILLALNIPQRDALNDFMVGKNGMTLEDYLKRYVKDSHSDAYLALLGLALGPLMFDAELARRALQGAGTDEQLLIELILNREPEELKLLEDTYAKRYQKNLMKDIKSDLSGKLEQLFTMALRSTPSSSITMVNGVEVKDDVNRLMKAAKDKDPVPFCEVLISRPPNHIRDVIKTFGSQYKSLSKVVKKTFSGDIELSLLYIIHGVKDKRDGRGIWRDAKLLEKSMAGFGTRETQLTYRLVRAQWSPARLQGVKTAYQNRYGKALASRVKGETSGPYRDVLLAIVNSA